MSQGCDIVSCVCKHAFQDRRYGKGKRVANYTAKGEGRCTVCSSIIRNMPNPIYVKKKSGTGGGRFYVAKAPTEGWSGGAPERNGWRP